MTRNALYIGKQHQKKKAPQRSQRTQRKTKTTGPKLFSRILISVLSVYSVADLLLYYASARVRRDGQAFARAFDANLLIREVTRRVLGPRVAGELVRAHA